MYHFVKTPKAGRGVTVQKTERQQSCSKTEGQGKGNPERQETSPVTASDGERKARPVQLSWSLQKHTVFIRTVNVLSSSVMELK